MSKWNTVYKKKITIYLQTKWCSISLTIKEEQIKESIFYLSDSQIFLKFAGFQYGTYGVEQVANTQRVLWKA